MRMTNARTNCHKATRQGILGGAIALVLALGGSAQAQEKTPPPDAPAKPKFQGFDSPDEKKESPAPETSPPEGAEKGYDGWSDGASPQGRSPTDPNASDPRFAKPGRFGPIAFAAKTPAVIFAYIPSYAWIIGAGVGMVYDPNGIPGPTGPTKDKLSGSLLLLAEYMAINEGPFALGPELVFQGSIAPGKFLSRKAVSGGVSWWFAPWWNAPVLIGGAWHVKVTKVQGLAAIYELETPSVRFGFLWR